MASIAAVLLIGVGLSPLAMQYANQIKQKSPQIAQKTTPSSDVALSPKTEFTFPTPQPFLTPADNLRSQPFLANTPPPANNSFPATVLTSPNSPFSPNGLTSNSAGKVNPALTTDAGVANPKAGTRNLPNFSKVSPQIAIESNSAQKPIAPALPGNLALAPQPVLQIVLEKRYLPIYLHFLHHWHQYL